MIMFSKIAKAVALAVGSLSMVVALGVTSSSAAGNDFFNEVFKASSGSSSGGGLFDFGGGNGGGGPSVVSFDPRVGKGQIIVSFGDRRLYLVTAKGKALAYPIAIPRDQSRWSGITRVSMKRINPPWTPTPTMRRENPKLPAFVPGGHPMNPLGVRGLYLGSSAYRIHGTDAPWTIGKAVSKGCIRMFNEDVVDLYDRVPVGMKVTVTWQKYL